MKGASTISLTIDSRPTMVPQGANLLDAARSLRIAIPTLCQIPSLPAQPGCRVCLVQVAQDGAVNLRAACSTGAAEGMEVLTEAEEAVKARRFVLEMLLADHPVDCLPEESIIFPAAASPDNGLRFRSTTLTLSSEWISIDVFSVGGAFGPAARSRAIMSWESRSVETGAS
ncbi:MAG: formate dehydrogenase, alpha subunit [candidate division NC10 bacterium]|nr:formate dehydrogenase, alpha subunit [candidate division NC10 bacterium]